MSLGKLQGVAELAHEQQREHGLQEHHAEESVFEVGEGGLDQLGLLSTLRCLSSIFRAALGHLLNPGTKLLYSCTHDDDGELEASEEHNEAEQDVEEISECIPRALEEEGSRDRAELDSQAGVLYV